MDCGPLGLVLKMSRAVGIAPFTYAPGFQVSRGLAIYGIFIIFNGLFVLATAVGDLLLSIKNEAVISATQVIKIFAMMLLTTINTLGVFTAPGRMTSMADYSLKLDQIDIKLQKYSKKSLKHKTNCKIPILTIGYFVLRLMYLVPIIVTNTWLMIITNVLYLLNFYILTLLQLQIVLFVQRANITFAAIKNNLQHLMFDGNTDSSTARNRSLRMENEIGNEENVESKIRELAISYGLICEIVTKINEADGAIIILTIVSLIFHLEINTFTLFAKAMSHISATDIVFRQFFSIFWTVCCTFFIIFIIEQFHQTHYEMERTFNIVNSRKSTVNKTEVGHELNLFFRMLILNNVTHSPLDMCTIGRPFMIKLFGCVITYLVILLQYGPETRNSLQLNDTTTGHK